MIDDERVLADALLERGMAMLPARSLDAPTGGFWRSGDGLEARGAWRGAWGVGYGVGDGSEDHEGGGVGDAIYGDGSPACFGRGDSVGCHGDGDGRGDGAHHQLDPYC